jgi:hypothetical protein
MKHIPIRGTTIGRIVAEAIEEAGEVSILERKILVTRQEKLEALRRLYGKAAVQKEA